MDIKHGRKRSGVKKQLRAKLEEWMNSIDNETVRQSAADNTIVTGGAIASMLLGEPVNDYDIYFRNIDASAAIADYYLFEAKKRKMVSNASRIQIRDAINIKGGDEIRVGVFIPSGGVSNKPADPDNDAPYIVSFMSENAITLTSKIQLITRFYGEPDQIHDNFDFAHACCYYDYKENNLVLPALALECMLSRTLIYKGSLYPIASIFRMKKFLERGWRITAAEQLKIMWQISELDLTNIVLLRDQLTGVDMAYMESLIDVLSGVNIGKLQSNYVSKIIDRVFSDDDNDLYKQGTE